MTFTKWLSGFILLLCSSCDGNTLYATQNKCKAGTWSRKDTCTFNFTIPDATQAYDVYLLLQYMPHYPYQNLHIQYQLQHEQAQVASTVSTNHLLFNSKTGKPIGKGYGKTKYLKLPLITHYTFEKPGDYSLALVQFMRIEELPGIASVGIQVCKCQPTTH